MFYSQAGQDVWAMQKTKGKGIYVDVGAYDGIESSNTYALELAGWKGICIEPNPQAFEKLYKNRKCIVIKDAATNTPCNTLCEILDAALREITVIDYLSIDVDGGEMDVLRGMDFKKYHVRLITIEHNSYFEGQERQEQIFYYLTGQGFKRAVKDVKCLDPNYYGAIYEDWYENIH